MRPILLIADRLPPLTGGMEMHARYFIEHFEDHPRFPLMGVVTRDAQKRDCLVRPEGLEPVALDVLPAILPEPPAIVFFNSGRWIEDLRKLRALFPAARFVYRTGGNEIIKAPLERVEIPDHRARQAFWVDTLNDCLDTLVTNSAYTEARHRDIGVKPELFLRCVGGVNARYLRSLPRPVASEHRPVWLCASRFVPYKNHELLIRSLALLHRRGLDFELRLVGDGPLLEPTQRLVRELGLGSKVRFLGLQDNERVCQELVAADAYVQLSMERVTPVPGGSYVHAEGMGRSILEALAAGTFVVAGRTGALPEIVTEDRGLLLELGESEQLAERLEPMLRTPPPRPEPLQGIGWEDFFARYEQAWEDGDASVAGH